MLFNLRALLFLLKRIQASGIYGVLIMGVISLSLFASSAYAQELAGLPVPVEATELVVGLIESSLIWAIPAAVAGVVILKLKFKSK